MVSHMSRSVLSQVLGLDKEVKKLQTLLFKKRSVYISHHHRPRNQFMFFRVPLLCSLVTNIVKYF